MREAIPSITAGHELTNETRKRLWDEVREFWQARDMSRPVSRFRRPPRADFGIHHRLKQYALDPLPRGNSRMLSDDLRRLVFEMFGRHFVSLLVCYRPKTGPDAGSRGFRRPPAIQECRRCSRRKGDAGHSDRMTECPASPYCLLEGRGKGDAA
jgi:hypothetical protein